MTWRWQLSGVCVFLLIGGLWSRQFDQSIWRLHWLVGSWQRETPRGTIYESWLAQGDLELLGKSFTVRPGGDTVLFETIQLVQRQDSVWYIPTVANQNAGFPVSFVLTSDQDDMWVFENRRHDFPQVISYRRIGHDSLVAEISGIQDGQSRRLTFPMHRVPSLARGVR